MTAIKAIHFNPTREKIAQIGSSPTAKQSSRLTDTACEVTQCQVILVNGSSNGVTNSGSQSTPHDNPLSAPLGRNSRLKGHQRQDGMMSWDSADKCQLVISKVNVQVSCGKPLLTRSPWIILRSWPHILWKALADPKSVDHSARLAAHKEECDGLRRPKTPEVIDKATVDRLGVAPMPTMNILTNEPDAQGNPL